MPLFSIITVCKNSEKTISRTIESVLKQTYKDFEYIIIDGLSTDNTLNIIKSYNDSRIKVISEKDNGIYDAMNKGIRNSRGSFIGIINSDDYYERETLEIVYKNILKEEKYQILYGMCKIIDINSKEKEIRLNLISNIEEQSLLHPSTFVSKYIYNDYGCYDENYKSASDYDFFLKTSKKNNIIFIPIYRVLSNFQLGGMSESIIGCLETIKIKNKNGIITKKEYFIKKIILTIKKIIKI